MKPGFPVRPLAAECLVAVGICAAGYLFLLDPLQGEFARVGREIRQASAVPPPTPGSSITPEQARQIMEDVQARTAAIELRSAIAQAESDLFASLMSLAAAHNIRVDGLTPGTAVATKARRQPADAAPPPPPPGVEVPEPPPADTRLEFVMNTVSGYSDLIRFVEALQRSRGYTVIKSIKVRPAEEAATDQVRATIETIHFAFDTTNIVRTAATGATP